VSLKIEINLLKRGIRWHTFKVTCLRCGYTDSCECGLTVEELDREHYVGEYRKWKAT
jgi:hypothetical protein|tara:strand:- start:14501 stop:14671 length:171 start_codon:yes stop_codon:yes gene_type:complete